MAIPNFILTAISVASLELISSIVISENLNRFGFNAPAALGPATETFVYADAARGASNYLGVFQGSGPNWPIHALPLDSFGNPLSDFSLAMTFQTDVNSNYDGAFTLLFKGKATVSPVFGSMTISTLEYDSLTNTSKYFLTPSTGGAITCTFTSASSGFDASTIKLIRPGLSENDKYDPRFVSLYDRAKIVRFMDWCQVNGNGTMVPNLQPRRFGCGVVEALELCNDLNKDAWICIPHGYTDAGITSLLTYWRDNLTPSRKIRVEWSNELWNYNLGSQFSEVRLWGMDEAQVISNNSVKYNTVCSANNDETVLSDDNAMKPKFHSFRRINNEVYVTHTGLVRYRNSEKYKITSRGTTSALNLIGTMVPALNETVTISVVSSTEFKYPNSGPDTGVFNISGVPVFTHTPIISVQMQAGVVTVQHDGSKVFTQGQNILVGTSSGALAGMRQYSPVPVNVIDAFTFTYQPLVLGSDISLTTSFNQNSYISIATNPSNPYLIAQSNTSSAMSADPSIFGQRLWIKRLYEISVIAKEVFGASYGTRCEIIYCDKNFEFGPFGGAREQFTWWEAAYKNTTGEINTWLHYVAHAPYIYINSSELPSVVSDSTGTAALQLLISKAPVQYKMSWKYLVAWARKYGVKTSCYEAGVDTAGNPTQNTTTFPIALRNTINSHPLMKDFTRTLADALVRYGVGEQVYYTGTVNWTLDKTGATGGIFDCWGIAQTMQSIKPVGTFDSRAPKLAGIDEYLINPMVPSIGDFSKGAEFTPNVNNTDYMFFETDNRGPAKTSVVSANQNQSASRGGYTIYSQGNFSSGYGWPKVTFLSWHETGGTANLYMTWKHDPDTNTTIDLMIDGVVQQTIVNPAPTSQAVFDSTSGFVETGPYLLNLPKGASLLSIALRARQTSSQNLVFKSMRLE